MDPEGDLACPSCGGAGGGPLGRAGGPWDTEDYVCPRCQGLGVLVARGPGLASAPPPASGRPGVAKAPPAIAATGARVASKR